MSDPSLSHFNINRPRAIHNANQREYKEITVRNLTRKQPSISPSLVEIGGFLAALHHRFGDVVRTIAQKHAWQEEQRLQCLEGGGRFLSGIVCCVTLAAQVCTAKGQASPGELVQLPFSRGNKIFTSRKEAGGGVAFCVQNGPNGKPRVLLTAADAPLNTEHPLPDLSISDDGRYCAYRVVQPNSRYEAFKFIDVDTGKKLADTLLWTHYGDLGWLPNGFYYGGYHEPATAKDSYSDERVLFHKLGTSQSLDQVVYEDPAHPARKYQFLTSYDHRFFILHIIERVAGQLLSSEWFRREGQLPGQFTPVQSTMAAGRFFLCDNVGDHLIYYTQYESPGGRIINVDASAPEEAHWKSVLPEPVDDGDPVMGKLVILKKREGGGNQALIYSLSGRCEREIPTEAGSTVDIQAGKKREKYVFVSVEAHSIKRYFRYDRRTNTLLPFL